MFFFVYMFDALSAYIKASKFLEFKFVAEPI